MNTKILGLGLGAGLAASTLGLIAVPALSSAQTSDPASAATAPASRPDRSARLAETLAPLVADGTISQSQSDAVVAALEANGPKGGRRGGHGPGLEVAAQALGMTTDELHTALHGGSTLAQVAADKGVDVQVIVDALVASARNHIAQEVTDGEITQEQADQKLADVDQRVTDMVNGVRPERGSQDGAKGGPRGGHGPRGQQGAPADAPAAN